MTIRVLIVDDHDVVAEGLRHLIEAQPDMEVVASVRDGREAVHWTIKSAPDIVLMDSAMPELNGTEATHLIRQRCPETKVIMVSMHSDPVHAVRALQAGASGYVLKRSAAKEVVDAIRAVRAGKRYLSEPLADTVIDQYLSGSTAQDLVQRLSSRERQVLQMLAEGKSMAEIAATLSLSQKTVETYRARMMDKLGIHDLAGLVRFAIKQGIASFD
jgi:two-component system, NarL family, response regulator NreC